MPCVDGRVCESSGLHELPSKRRPKNLLPICAYGFTFCRCILPDEGVFRTGRGVHSVSANRASRFLPFLVSLYVCNRLLGFSGMVYAINPLSTNERITFLR